MLKFFPKKNYSHPIELYSESPYFIGLYDVESTKTHAAPVP